MIKKEVVVKEKNGIHARPAGILVKVAGQFKSSIYIVVNEKRVNAKSIMGVMSLGVRENQQISIEAHGEDENNAVNEIIKLIESNFEIKN